MDRVYKKWRSPSLGKEMEILVFGNEGTPVLVFPTEEGRFHEWEDQGMLRAVEEQIESGFNQIFCVDSIMHESLFNQKVDAYTRVIRLQQYESYIIEEVLQFISESNSRPFLMSTGCRMGGYLSLLLALKHPEEFGKVIAMSGRYDIRPLLDEFYDDNVYYNNPVDFMPNLHKESFLKSIQNLDIRLLSYANDENRQSTERMSDTLWMRFIEHEIDIYGKAESDPWPLWKEMLSTHII